MKKNNNNRVEMSGASLIRFTSNLLSNEAGRTTANYAVCRGTGCAFWKLG